MRSWLGEVGVLAGAEPIDGLLLTPWPVRTLKMARRLVRWYALRWGIECWHKVLKVVCGVERRQLKSAQALERALALDMIVTSRVLLLSRLGKEHPGLPAHLFYVRRSWPYWRLKKATAKYRQIEKLTVRQANMLVGFWGRTGDGARNAPPRYRSDAWHGRLTSCTRRRGSAPRSRPASRSRAMS